MSDKKFTSVAGPRQTKAVAEVISKFNWRSKSVIEKYGVIGGEEWEHVVTPMVTGTMTPESRVTYDRIGEKYGWEITAKNYKSIVADFEAETKALVLPVVDQRRSPEAETARVAEMKAAEEKRAAEAVAFTAEVDKIEAELRAEYPWAVASDGKLSEPARAAKNIKIELTKAFPGVKFSVKSDQYSMGNSVDVYWTDGPTSDQVRELTAKYQGGTFDSMTDMYEDDDSAFSKAASRVFGKSKYVSENRRISDGFYEAVGRMLAEKQHVEYQGDNTLHVFGKNDNETLGTHVSRIIHANAIPPLGTLIGIENDQDIRWYHRLVFELPLPAEAPAGADDEPPIAAEVQKHFHTKKQKDFWLVVLTDRVDRETFEALRDRAKAAGGWYSRQWGTTPGGFGFGSEADAVAFAAAIGGATDNIIDNLPVTNSVTGGQATAEKLREMADKLQAEIDHKTRDLTQNWTPKRGRQLATRMHEGRNLERAQRAMRAVADAYEAGTLPPELRSIRTQVKRDFLDYTATRGDSTGYYEYHETDTYRDNSAIAVALREFVNGAKSPAEREAELAAKRQAEVDSKINELRRSTIDGFFPTPDAVIDRMLDEADIEAGHRVLEPSAGIGSILDKIRERHGIDADAVEINYPLAEVLELKGFYAHRGDFLEYWNREGEYDRIVMNPPFDRGADVKHVRHAFELLKPGGRLVALMGNGAAFSKASELIDEFGWSERLPSGSFAGRDSFNQTGVEVNLVVLDKPAVDTDFADDETDLVDGDFKADLTGDAEAIESAFDHDYLAFL